MILESAILITRKNCPYNSNGDKNDLSINYYGFPEGYMLPTSVEQDNIIRKTFMGISQNENYDLFGNNCTTATQRALEAAGIQTYDKNRRSYRVPANHYVGESSYNVTHENARPIVPSTSYQSIIRYNPKGKMILRNKR